ncbi:uncharacterized protein LOC129751103 isoform X2 [Uranotaenia lowii]|uniref:uncharacterized protein LOC129751103 isoform X2 n=1 Tax=Uranotaenia lowii TaxID=190385 RepID=UPI0024784C41|nr:uncharacterized protein LOC129751103 isoform X2 [Uranotaenia lowii]
MAVSLLTSLCNSGLEQLCQTPEPLKFYYHYSDAGQAVTDFGRRCLSNDKEEQMEYGNSFYNNQQHHQQQQQTSQQLIQHPPHQQSNQQDFEEISQNYNLDNDDNYSESPNNFQDYRNNFVDSPPDSKEAWPVEYSKMSSGLGSGSGPANTSATTAVAAVAAAAAAAAVAAQQHQQQQQQQHPQQQESNFSIVMPNRKRRLEWMSAQQDEDNEGSSEPKINSADKDRDIRRKGTMRWPEELDLDLSNELSSNGYISDSLLNFPVFKQELPSPPQKLGHEVIKSVKTANGSGSLQQQQHSQQHHHHHHHHHQVQNQEQQHHGSPSTQQQQSLGNNNVNGTTSNGGGGGVQQQQQQSSVGNDHSLGGGSMAPSAMNNVGGLQSFMHASRYDSTGNINQLSESIQRSDIVHDDNRFQYVLAAATSIATKNNEESLTYLNQGQSYEIKLKKLGDLSPFRGKILKSVLKICFHERRLQYMEREQMQLWQASRPGERILDVDIPLSYGLIQVQPNSSSLLNTMEIYWDPMKEVGVYVKINCISTEFTPKKHGGEKGVPFRIQVETYLDSTLNDTGNNPTPIEGTARPLHAAACQIKVFKLKGADRKHKQDREKVLKRPPAEQDKYQRSCDCTILTDITTESMLTPLVGSYSPEHIKRNISPLLGSPASPVHMNKFENIMTSFCNGGSPSAAVVNAASKTAAMAAAVAVAASSNPIGNSNVSSTNGLCTNTNNSKLMDQNVLSPTQGSVEMDDYVPTITKDSGPATLTQWLNYHRLSAYSKTFSQFSGSDLLRMSKDDLCKICGLADGIRMFNILHSKAITPRLTIYVCYEGNLYHAIYLHANTISELTQSLQRIPGFVDALQGLNSSDIGNPWVQRSLKATINGLGSSGSKYQNVTTSDVHTSLPSPSSPISSSSAAPRFNLLVNGPNGVHVLLTEDVLNNIKDESLFQLEIKPSGNVLMKAVAASGSVTNPGNAGDNDMN